jgi:arylsulfatase
MAQDREEKTNVAATHPEIVERLQAIAEKARAELGDSLTGRTGAGAREPGRLPARPR